MIARNSIYTPNPNYQLEPYQRRGIIGGEEFGNVKSVKSLREEGKKNILLVSPGGSGKTVIAAKIAYDFISESTQDVAIFVHRKELLDHARLEIEDWYGIYSQKIDSETKNINSNCRIFVCMVETFDRRSVESFLKYFDNVGLYMIDECHLQHFNKIFNKFPNAIRIGLTATPISADKNRPLKVDYDDIIVVSTLNELIELNKNKPNRGVVSCEGHDYSIDIGVDYKNLKKKTTGEFDEQFMGKAFSQKIQIRNTLDAYEKHSLGKKCIIFNANIEHSLKMHNEMLYYGFNSQHIDSDTKSKYSSKSHRKFIFGDGNNKGWLNNTDDAILNNVGIATIGTDVKSILSVFINKSTASFTLFWQMVFRANRAYVCPITGKIKKYFTLIDTGNNMLPSGQGHGVYWDEKNFDWEYRFVYPKEKKKKEGLAPIKSCPECGAINTAQARYCTAKVISPLDLGSEFEESECGYIFSFNSDDKEEDETIREMILVSSLINNKIDVSKTIFAIQETGKNLNSGFFETIKQCCNLFSKEIKSKEDYDKIINKYKLEELEKITINKVCEWFKLTNIKKWINYKVTTKEEIKKHLKYFGFEIQEIEETSPLDL